MPSQKLLKACIDQHQVVLGRGGAPALADVAYLMLLDGFSLTVNLAMAQSSHACLQVVVDTLLGRYQPYSQGMDVVILNTDRLGDGVGGILTLQTQPETKSPSPADSVDPDPLIGMDYQNVGGGGRASQTWRTSRERWTSRNPSNLPYPPSTRQRKEVQYGVPIHELS